MRFFNIDELSREPYKKEIILDPSIFHLNCNNHIFVFNDPIRCHYVDEKIDAKGRSFELIAVEVKLDNTHEHFKQILNLKDNIVSIENNQDIIPFNFLVVDIIDIRNYIEEPLATYTLLCNHFLIST